MLLTQAPLTWGTPVTPSDTVNIADQVTLPPNAYGACRAFSIGIAGTIKILTVDWATLTYGSGELALGIVHPIAIRRVFSTGTSADGIKAYN